LTSLLEEKLLEAMRESYLRIVDEIEKTFPDKFPVTTAQMRKHYKECAKRPKQDEA